MPKHKILWEVLEELFTQECSSDGRGLTLIFLRRSNLLLGVNMGRVHENYKRFRCKNSLRQLNSTWFFCNRGQDNPVTFNKCPSYFDSFKLLDLSNVEFDRWPVSSGEWFRAYRPFVSFNAPFNVALYYFCSDNLIAVLSCCTISCVN